MNQDRTPLQTDKATLAAMIKKLIDHCRIVAETSHSDEYRKMERLRAMTMISGTLLPMLKHPEQWNLRDICHFTRLHMTDLYKILPVQSNSSYAKSVEKLEDINRIILINLNK